jgi:ADP-ribosylglycohydrolase
VRKASGSLYGLAFGDSLRKPTEFEDDETIVGRYGPGGEPVAVLGRGAASSGDSDSIACLAGSFAGAALGLDAWPAAWAERIEYAERIARLERVWDRSG